MADADISINIVAKDLTKTDIASAKRNIEELASAAGTAAMKEVQAAESSYNSVFEYYNASFKAYAEAYTKKKDLVNGLELQKAEEDALKESEKIAKKAEASERASAREWETSMRSITTAYASSKKFVNDFDKALSDQNLTLQETLDLLGQTPKLFADFKDGIESISKLTGLSTGTIAAATGYFAILAAGAVLEYKNYERTVNQQKAFQGLSKEVASTSQTYEEYLAELDLADTSTQAFTMSTSVMLTGMSHMQMGAVAMTRAEWELEQATKAVNRAHVDTITLWQTDWYSAYKQSVHDYAIEQQKLTTEYRDFLAETQMSFHTLTQLQSHFDGIVGYAKNYDVVLGQINDSETRMAALKEILIKGGGYFEGTWISARKAKEEIQDLSLGIKDAYAGLEEMANQVVLDMFKSTIAIGGISVAEMDAYFAMAADMGIISEEAATNAKQVYSDAITTINNMEIADKTSYAHLDARSYLEQYEFIQGLMIADKHGRVMLDFYVNNYPLGKMTDDWANLNENNNNPVIPNYGDEIGDNTSKYSGSAQGNAPVTVVINAQNNFADAVWVDRELSPLIKRAVQQANRGR
jgi:hypothetical protein